MIKTNKLFRSLSVKVSFILTVPTIFHQVQTKKSNPFFQIMNRSTFSLTHSSPYFSLRCLMSLEFIDQHKPLSVVSNIINLLPKMFSVCSFINCSFILFCSSKISTLSFIVFNTERKWVIKLPKFVVCCFIFCNLTVETISNAFIIFWRLVIDFIFVFISLVFAMSHLF